MNLKKLNQIVLAFTVFTSLFANAQEYLIFKPERDTVLFPVKYYLNGAFDVIQNPEWFNQESYSQKHKEVFNRIKNPDKSIRRDGGYKKLFEDEFFSKRVIPNIGLHTLGSSYDVFWLNEYYTHFNAPSPFLMSALTVYAVHFGNEALESGNKEISSHDHIADIYFFDVLGVYLGQNRKYIEFLREDLGMRAWHSQPIWNFKTEDIFNPGLNYIYRPKIFEMGSVRPIIFTGMQNMTGLSYDSNNVTHSALMGVALTDPLENKGRFVVSYAVEHNDSLVLSFFVNSAENMRYKINMYPNFLNLFSEEKFFNHLGVVFGQNREREYLVGLDYYLPIGF